MRSLVLPVLRRRLHTRDLVGTMDTRDSQVREGSLVAGWARHRWWTSMSTKSSPTSTRSAQWLSGTLRKIVSPAVMSFQLWACSTCPGLPFQKKATIGADFLTKEVMIDDKLVTMQAHLWLYKYLQGWRECLFVPTAIWLHCSDESKTGLFGSFQQHLWRLNFLLVANNPAHSTPFAVCDRFGILLDKSGFNPWACALMDPDRPRRTRVWVHGSYGSVGMGGSWVSFLRCRVLSRCWLLCPGARSDSLGAKDFRIETLDSDQMLTGNLGDSFVGFGEDTSAASCVDLRCIGRYDMIKSYDSQWYICTYLLTYLPTYKDTRFVAACLHTCIHSQM